ncbi:MAG: hypothetical protein WC859_07605 [Elusimicrobiota bacterium]
MIVRPGGVFCQTLDVREVQPMETLLHVPFTFLRDIPSNAHHTHLWIFQLHWRADAGRRSAV